MNEVHSRSYGVGLGSSVTPSLAPNGCWERYSSEQASVGALSAESEASKVDEYTTVMVLNIPHQISMAAFVEELNAGHFRGSFNFCNIPRMLTTGKNLGFAFVNFEESASARAFAEAWDRRDVFGKGKRLRTKPAKIQGLEANLVLAQKSMKRKSTSFKPLLSL